VFPPERLFSELELASAPLDSAAFATRHTGGGIPLRLFLPPLGHNSWTEKAPDPGERINGGLPLYVLSEICFDLVLRIAVSPECPARGRGLLPPEDRCS